MSLLSYEALNAAGKQVSGTIEATNRTAALELLTKQGLKPFSLKDKNKQASIDSLVQRVFGSRVKIDVLVVFTRQLATMVSAGVPLLRALNSLKDHTNSKVLRDALGGVCQDIQGGLSLASALGRHPNIFNDIYVNMVQAGETGGVLDEVLNRLAIQQEKASSMRKKIKGALTYPTILLIITTLAFFGLMLFVIPQIGKILTDLGGPDAKLPLLTLIMLGISGFMIKFWYVLVVGMVGGFMLLKRFLRTPSGKRLFHRILLRTPILKNIIIKVAIARFSRTFASLMGAGVNVVEALTVTSGTVGNVLYEEAIKKSVEEIKNGKQLSQTLEGSPLFPDVVSQMLAVGEETGKTDTVLIKVADFYEEEVDVVLDSLSAIIEPVMIVFMGSMVGLIAASVMGPITSIAQNIKG